MGARTDISRKRRSTAAPPAGSAAWLFEDSEDLYVETDAEGRVTHANPALARRLDVTGARLLGRPLASLVHPEDLEAFGKGARFRLASAEAGWAVVEGRARTLPDGSLAGHFAPVDEAKAAFGALAEAAGVWTWTLEPATRRFARHGLPPERSAPRIRTLDDMQALLLPEDARRATEILERAMREGGEGAYECRGRAVGGEDMILEVRFLCSERPGGAYAVHGLSREITDQARTRSLALENAERLRIALGAARAGVCEIDFKSQTVWCPEEVTRILGQPLEFSFPGQTPWPMCPPEDREKIVSAPWTGAHHDPLEVRVVHPSGEVRWIELHGERQLDEAGQFSKITALILDVDARKRQELALIEARSEAQANAKRLKVAMDAAKAGVFETDFEKGTFWSTPEFVEIVGTDLTFEQASGVWPIIHPDDAAKIKAAIEHSQANRAEARAEWRVRLPSGGYRWIEARGLPTYDGKGNPLKLTGVVLDIDARKRQELALIEAQRSAEAAAEAKSQFLANMSHEIRTPMNGVLGVLHLLGNEVLSEEGRKLLGEAESCGRMLSQLLNDVIDFSRIEAGRLDLSPEPLDPVAVLESVADLLRPQAEAKGVALVARSTGPKGWALADPVRLRQGLFNLIGNAVKFTPAGRVEARLTASRTKDGRRRLRYEIEDTGVGIPEAVQASLFQRFTQADGSSARQFGGSGLGLAITKRLAEMMGGKVGFTSAEGKGSTFWIEIIADPAAAPTAAASAAAAKEEGAILGGFDILLVEDNPTNRLVGRKILESLGARVDTADDGVEGVKAVRDRPYDLVLMDVQMPRMDGLEATRRIRALKGPECETPIVGLTANVLSHQRERYLAVGMNGVAAKPITPALLVAEIARVFEAAGQDEAADASA